mgnify:CR=1 FL=1
MEKTIQIALVAVTWLILSAALVWAPAWLLWNNVAAPVFGLPPLTYLQSVGVLILIWLAINGMAKVSVKIGPTD